MSDDDDNPALRGERSCGGRGRLRRRLTGPSRPRFERAGGDGAQRIRKDERGATAIDAAKLLALAQRLHVPIDHFFEGLDVTGEARLDRGRARDPRPERILIAADAADWARAVARIRSPVLRQAILRLIEAMAQDA